MSHACVIVLPHHQFASPQRRRSQALTSRALSQYCQSLSGSRRGSQLTLCLLTWCVTQCRGWRVRLSAAGRACRVMNWGFRTCKRTRKGRICRDTKPTTRCDNHEPVASSDRAGTAVHHSSRSAPPTPCPLRAPCFLPSKCQVAGRTTLRWSGDPPWKRHSRAES